jgi:hypothetical protein
MGSDATMQLKTREPQIQGSIKTDSGTLHWDFSDQAPITLHGHLPFFAQFLEVGNLFSGWVGDCPLAYASNNAPRIRDVLGTIVLSVLSGHRRYCHSAALYGDQVAAGLLGLSKIVSHDSLSRGLKKMDEGKAEEWIHAHLLRKTEPLLQHAYVLDIDATVKTVYGSQEGATVGYNPHKPGRPSYCYHTYMVGAARLVMDVDVLPGNQTAGCYSHPGLWRILDGLPPRLHPTFVRGDIAYGNEGTMSGCEDRGVHYLFKMRKSSTIKTLCNELSKAGTEWKDAGSGWQATETRLHLGGWSRSRRVVLLRRPQKKGPPTQILKQPGRQDEFEFVEEDAMPQYDWSILVTSLDYDLRTLGQLYRDRGDCENVFDELKNQWGWGGFTTQTLKPTRIMAGIIALVFNWWNIFCRLADPAEHMEAITSRPMLQNVIGCLAKSGGKRMLHLSMSGKNARETGLVFEKISSFLTAVSTAPQLKPEEKWTCVLKQAFQSFLKDVCLLPVSDGTQLLLV